MCGIAAIIGEPESARTPYARAAMAAALDKLHRRGPDDRAAWLSPCGCALLGHSRLSINDLSTSGRQPMVDPAGGAAIICNGEIYNAPALRRELEALGAAFGSRSDSEVALHGLSRWGFARTIDRLRGMFALAAWEPHTRTLHAAVDPAGMKPIVWWTDGRRFALASDCDALRALLPHPPELDRAALCDVLCLGYSPPPRTVYRGVRKLAPGEALSVRVTSRGVEATTWRHWSPPPIDPDRARDDDAAAFAPLWQDVVGDHLLSDVPVKVFLSAGLDSSSVAAALAGSTDRPECLTLALEGGDDESAEAAETAAMLGLPHRRVAFSPGDLAETLADAADAFDEPQTFGALLTMTRIAAAARESAKVVISGDGGDEAFAGYDWHRPASDRVPPTPGAREEHAHLAAKLLEPDASPGDRWRALHALSRLSFVHSHISRLVWRWHPAEAAAALGLSPDEYDADRLVEPLAPWDDPSQPDPRRAQRLDLMTFCAGSILPKVDRAAMAVGLEVRAPFLDRRVLEWCLSRPAGAADLESPKAILRNYLAGRVPDRVLTRPKQGFSLRFTGGVSWQRTLDETCRPSALVRDGVLAPGWERFIGGAVGGGGEGGGVPERESRMYGLCFLAAWYQRRFA